MTSLLISARAFHFAAGMVLVGVVAFRWLVLLPVFADETEETWRGFTPFFRLLHRFFISAGIVLLLSGVALFWAVASDMSDLPLPDALNRETLGTVFFQTRFGHVFQWRLGLAILLAVLMGKLLCDHWYLRRRPTISERLAGFTALGLTVSFAWTGHAAASAGSILVWSLAADALHLFASAIWPAGLLPLAFFLRQARRLKEGAVQHAPVLGVVRRFSVVSLVVVGILMATGLINTVFLVGSFPAMWTTLYGRLLCLKITLFLFLFGVAAWNRCRLLPMLEAIPKTGADQASAYGLLRRLQGFVTMELGLAGIIVLVTAILGTTPPPR